MQAYQTVSEYLFWQSQRRSLPLRASGLVLEIETTRPERPLSLLVASHIASHYPNLEVAVGGLLPRSRPAWFLSHASQPLSWRPDASLDSYPTHLQVENFHTVSSAALWTRARENFDVVIWSSLRFETQADLSISVRANSLEYFDTSPGSLLSSMLDDKNHSSLSSWAKNHAGVLDELLSPMAFKTSSSVGFEVAHFPALRSDPKAILKLLIKTLFALPGPFGFMRFDKTLREDEYPYLHAFLEHALPEQCMQEALLCFLKDANHAHDLLCWIEIAKNI